MKKETVIIIVAIAALAALWYFFIYKKNQTTTTVTPGVQTPPVTATTPTTPAAVVNGAPSTNATATGASQTLTQTPDVASARPSTGVNPVGVTPVDSSQFDAVILPWMNSFGAGNKAQALAQYPNMTPDEKSMLVDFITNLWPGKRPQTAQDTTNWNNWRTKYHIYDGTYSPFAGDAQTAYAGSNSFDNPQDAYVAHSIDPLTPVQNSQTANSFVIKGSGGEAVNNFKQRGRKKK